MIKSSAYGGDRWAARTGDHRDDIGAVWAPFAIDTEWRPLKAVLLHRPGRELLASADDPDKVQMLAPVDWAKAEAEHDQMAEVYRALGIAVHYVEPDPPSAPNQMFCADTFVMTPAGAVVARPASTVRAGEERWVQRRLAALGAPVVKTFTGRAVFEGADLMWLDPNTAIVGHGLRTNDDAIAQLDDLMAQIGCELIAVDMPVGTMHLMGMLRIIDKDLALVWPTRTPFRAVQELQLRGYRIADLPEADDATRNRAMNFVTLAPRKVLMVAGLTGIQDWLEGLGVECLTSPTDELSKAAGNIGCLTGVLSRERSPCRVPGR